MCDLVGVLFIPKKTETHTSRMVSFNADMGWIVLLRTSTFSGDDYRGNRRENKRKTLHVKIAHRKHLKADTQTHAHTHRERDQKTEPYAQTTKSKLKRSAGKVTAYAALSISQSQRNIQTYTHIQPAHCSRGGVCGGGYKLSLKLRTELETV